MPSCEDALRRGHRDAVCRCWRGRGSEDGGVTVSARLCCYLMGSQVPLFSCIDIRLGGGAILAFRVPAAKGKRTPSRRLPPRSRRAPPRRGCGRGLRPAAVNGGAGRYRGGAARPPQAVAATHSGSMKGGERGGRHPVDITTPVAAGPLRRGMKCQGRMGEKAAPRGGRLAGVAYTWRPWAPTPVPFSIPPSPYHNPRCALRTVLRSAACCSQGAAWRHPPNGLAESGRARRGIRVVAKG